MTNAPEKIWAYAGSFKMWRGHKTDKVHGVQTEYTRTDIADARIEELEAALTWYGEQSRLCRLVHSGGNDGRHNLAYDGGKKAREALQAKT